MVSLWLEIDKDKQASEVKQIRGITVFKIAERRRSSGKIQGWKTIMRDKVWAVWKVAGALVMKREERWNYS